jgi:hypothetical protein
MVTARVMLVNLSSLGCPVISVLCPKLALEHKKSAAKSMNLFPIPFFSIPYP